MITTCSIIAPIAPIASLVTEIFGMIGTTLDDLYGNFKCDL